MSLCLGKDNYQDVSGELTVHQCFTGSTERQESLACGDWRNRNPQKLFRYVIDKNKNASEDSEDEDIDSEEGDVFDVANVSKTLDKFFIIWHSSLMVRGDFYDSPSVWSFCFTCTSGQFTLSGLFSTCLTCDMTLSQMTCLFLVIVGIVLRFHFTSIVLNSVKSNPYYQEYEKFVAFRSAPRELNFGHITQTLGNALMILNSVHILCIMMYMSFQIHKNHFTLPVVCFISGVVVIMEINTTHVYMSSNSAPIKNATKELTNKINCSYAVEDTNVISVTHDIFAVWGHCCGVQELYDFQDLPLSFSAKRDKDRSPIAYPPTCCNETKFKQLSEAKDKLAGFDSTIKQCAMLGDGVYAEGCFVMLFNWLNMYCVLYSIVIMVQLFDIFIHLAMYNKMVKMFSDICDMY
ncbi:hypothetical protein Btru_070444 [Bulinus truncatus]|nr:hypothetical protein Btru_070444 [Bulinus truncatus]